MTGSINNNKPTNTRQQTQKTNVPCKPCKEAKAQLNKSKAIQNQIDSLDLSCLRADNEILRLKLAEHKLRDKQDKQYVGANLMTVGSDLFTQVKTSTLNNFYQIFGMHAEIDTTPAPETLTEQIEDNLNSQGNIDQSSCKEIDKACKELNRSDIKAGELSKQCVEECIE